MAVSFHNITLGTDYSRHELADEWGYQSFHAIARGVVTPQDDNKIVLFVTREKQSSAEQYDDHISDDQLHWEGPTDHFAEDRMIPTSSTEDEIHLFFRERHHTDFTYYGRIEVDTCECHIDRPSRFVFRLADWIAPDA